MSMVLPNAELFRIGVAGAGVMGTGIALVAARARFEVVLFDTRSAALESSLGTARAFLAKSAALGRLAESAEKVVDRIKPTTDVSAMGDCELVIEAVFEDLVVKRSLIRQLDDLCREDAVFATNTSTLSVTEIAAASRRPDRVVGMHFCLPPALVKLVEMTPGLRTDAVFFERAWNLCVEMGQEPVRTPDTPGFILNRFIVPYHNDAIRLVADGVAKPAEIDCAVREGLGYAMGPFELLDMVGLDTQVLLSDALYARTHDARAAAPALLRAMVAAGFLGKKSGRGFRYSGQEMVGRS